MTTAHPLNSREYHEAAYLKHFDTAIEAIADSDVLRANHYLALATYHAAERHAAAPAQTAPEGMPAR